MTVRNLEQQALKLKPIERIHLVEKILESLNMPDKKIEKVWVAESEARYSAYKKGDIKGVSFSEVKKRLKK